MKSFLKLASVVVFACGIAVSAEGMNNQINAEGVTLNAEGMKNQIKGIKVIDNKLNGKPRKTIVVGINFFNQEICRCEPSKVAPVLASKDPVAYLIQRLIWLSQVYSMAAHDTSKEEVMREIEKHIGSDINELKANETVYEIYCVTKKIDNSSY